MQVLLLDLYLKSPWNTCKSGESGILHLKSTIRVPGVLKLPQDTGVCTYPSRQVPLVYLSFLVTQAFHITLPSLYALPCESSQSPSLHVIFSAACALSGNISHCEFTSRWDILIHAYFLDDSWMCLDFKEEITTAPVLWRKTLLSTCTCSWDILHLPGLLSEIPWWPCNHIRNLGTLSIRVESLRWGWTRWACLVHLTTVLVRLPFAPEPAGETQPCSHFPLWNWTIRWN